MTEPGAGSDLAWHEGKRKIGWHGLVLNGHKALHLPRGASPILTIAFMATAKRDTPRGPKKLIVPPPHRALLCYDKDTPGYQVRDGYRNGSHRGYTQRHS